MVWDFLFRILKLHCPEGGGRGYNPERQFESLGGGRGGVCWMVKEQGPEEMDSVARIAEGIASGQARFTGHWTMTL